MSLIPLLRLYNEVGNFFGTSSKTYAGIWLAQPPSACRSPSICCATTLPVFQGNHRKRACDGASDFEIFVKIVLPLSFPALASFAIFQFLWVWNDLLIAIVFLGTGRDQLS